MLPCHTTPPSFHVKAGSSSLPFLKPRPSLSVIVLHGNYINNKQRARVFISRTHSGEHGEREKHHCVRYAVFQLVIGAREMWNRDVSRVSAR